MWTVVVFSSTRVWVYGTPYSTRSVPATYQSRETLMSCGFILGLTSLTFAPVLLVLSGMSGSNSIEPTSIDERTGSVMSTLSSITRLRAPFVSPTMRRTRSFSS